jgi:hypothetical protein
MIRTHATPAETYHLPPSNANLGSIQLPLSSRCPFCADRQAYLNTEPGSGVLTVLVSTTSNPFPHEWRILRVCRADEVTSSDWDMVHGPGGLFRQMAWIPRPCGRVQVIGGEQRIQMQDRRGSGVRMEVSCTWRQPLKERVRSRLPGMFSELNAALLAGNDDRN